MLISVLHIMANISQVSTFMTIFIQALLTYSRSLPIMSKLNAGFPLLCHAYPGFPYYAKPYPSVLPIKSSSTFITTFIPGQTLPILCQHFYPRCCKIIVKIWNLPLFHQHLSQVFSYYVKIYLGYSPFFQH